jgi:ABC-type uncharacterized transport system permease subunit
VITYSEIIILLWIATLAITLNSRALVLLFEYIAIGMKRNFIAIGLAAAILSLAWTSFYSLRILLFTENSTYKQGLGHDKFLSLILNLYETIRTDLFNLLYLMLIGMVAILAYKLLSRLWNSFSIATWAENVIYHEHTQ